MTILEDCRIMPVKQMVTGQKATFLGRSLLGSYPKMKRYRGSHDVLATPVFRLTDGTKIWGIECWWERADGA